MNLRIPIEFHRSQRTVSSSSVSWNSVAIGVGPTKLNWLQWVRSNRFDRMAQSDQRKYSQNGAFRVEMAHSRIQPIVRNWLGIVRSVVGRGRARICSRFLEIVPGHTKFPSFYPARSLYLPVCSRTSLRFIYIANRRRNRIPDVDSDWPKRGDTMFARYLRLVSVQSAFTSQLSFPVSGAGCN